MRNEMPIAELRKHFTYESESGVVRKVTPGTKSPFGNTCAKGYIRFKVANQSFAAHRIAWALHHGEWPDMAIDHKDRNPSNNRLCNLRLASNASNLHNKGCMPFNTSGYKGVGFNKAHGRYVALISVRGLQHWLGTYEDPALAAMAYDRAATYFHGEFAVTNWTLGLLAQQAAPAAGSQS